MIDIPETIGIEDLESRLDNTPRFSTTISNLEEIGGLFEEIGRISHTDGATEILNVIVPEDYVEFSQAAIAHDVDLAFYIISTQLSNELALQLRSYDRRLITTGAEKITLGQVNLIPLSKYGHNTLLQSLDDAGVAYKKNPKDIDSHQEISLFGDNAVLNPIELLEGLVRNYEQSESSSRCYNIENLKSGLDAAKRGIIPISDYSRTKTQVMTINDFVSGTPDQINHYLKTKEIKGMKQYDASDWKVTSKNFRN